MTWTERKRPRNVSLMLEVNMRLMLQLVPLYLTR